MKITQKELDKWHPYIKENYILMKYSMKELKEMNKEKFNKVMKEYGVK